MTDKQLNGLRVAILATDGFEEAELLEPRKALDAAGAKTTVIAPKSGKIQGMKHDEKSERVAVDTTFDNANPADFDAVLLPGGALNADALRVVRPAQQFVQEFNNAHKPIAFICHAPWLLVSAGLTRGRTVTSYHTIQDDVRNATLFLQGKTTEVLAEFPGDAHFPSIDPNDWREMAREDHVSEGGLDYRFLILERIRDRKA